MIESKRRILVADDEPDIVELLKYNLEQNGYIVDTAYNGEEAVEQASQNPPDLIILDVMMPVMDGFEAGQKLRNNPKTSEIPFVFLTARNEEENELKGLDIGADDYIQKPIKNKLLQSRLQTILRRVYPQESDKDLLHFENISINKNKHQVIVNGESIKLAKKEFKLLYLLAKKPGKVFLREEILNKIWGNDVIVGDRTIDVHIRKIRAKVGINCIQTVKGMGYKFDL